MIPTLVVVAVIAFAASFLGTRLLVQVLRARAILDHPNERSSHAAPTPVGGGLVVIGVIGAEGLVVWGLSGVMRHGDFGLAVPLIVALAAALGVMSWRDDRRPLSPAVRLGVQALVVAAGLIALSAGGHVFQGTLPAWLDLALTAFLWLWLINLTNFMDGIDGISGVEGAAIGIGVMLLAPFAGAASVAFGAGHADVLALLGIIVAAAMAGFLYFNWQPAQIFLGDVGAVPLGLLFGWLLFELAGAGLWVAALLLPLYYVMDATLTLMRRIVRRERIMQAHRSHFYQRAARRLGSHARVSSIVLVLNAVLVALAYTSALQPAHQIAALATGVVLTAAVLWYFAPDAAPKP
jgi:UDP-N-acetylmuramyl pentapeptide phosphotransferase/UDP-N-acetylglucosamine-1-phosphate transferase